MVILDDISVVIIVVDSVRRANATSMIFETIEVTYCGTAQDLLSHLDACQRRPSRCKAGTTLDTGGHIA